MYNINYCIVSLAQGNISLQMEDISKPVSLSDVSWSVLVCTVCMYSTVCGSHLQVLCIEYVNHAYTYVQYCMCVHTYVQHTSSRSTLGVMQD